MFSLLALLLVAAQVTEPSNPEPGVSEGLARERAAALADVRYALELEVPDARDRALRGHLDLSFTLDRPRDVVLDFARAADRVRVVRTRGRDIEPRFTGDHLVVAAADTAAGPNRLSIEFDVGDEPLNRGDDFLYSLFVPARARFAFPCFDQPDIKARYTLALTIPEDWVAVSNGAEVRRVTGAGRARVEFAETAPISTYLFSFVAGRLSVETAVRDGRTFRMFHRERDPARLARNRDAVFDLHATALAWLEDYTGIPYPFGKFDVVLVPSFQFGGMEHPGAILYNASSLLLEESATQNQRLDRASLIAHETAHMWFGDLVTMRWFDDVWMKEVFANFMAARIVNPSFPELNHDLRFLLAHHPAAYDVDRTAGTNAIRQPLSNLLDAGQLYGAVIYQKAPIALRQLEGMVGEVAFRDGLRAYLRRHANGNAGWLDLVGELDRLSGEDVRAWSDAWIEQRGRPVLTTALTMDAGGRVGSLELVASDPFDRGLLWPQRFRVTLGLASGLEHVEVRAATSRTEVVAAGSPLPLFVLPGSDGLGYGRFVLDEASRRYLVAHIEDVPDPLVRGAAWVALWEEMLDGALSAREFVDMVVRAAPIEPDEQNVQRALRYLVRAFWRFLPTDDRMSRAQALEPVLRAALAQAPSAGLKAAWFAAFRETVLTPGGLAWMHEVWARDTSIPGLPLAETDEIAMAMELAVRGVDDAAAVVAAQVERTMDPDRKARLQFVQPALSADQAVREAAFARLAQVEQRRREPWVLESLAYLSHPLRAAHAERFVEPGLVLLEDVQRTGDIFFPLRWTAALLGGHRTPAAARLVHDFLASHPGYPYRLRWTVLTAADDLFRTAGR
ncbi:MAG: hypothetical protein HOP14_01380 [Acidobacteria bacterium]|nr:hypothetical protein [Acidobacteriota bacterium]